MRVNVLREFVAEALTTPTLFLIAVSLLWNVSCGGSQWEVMAKHLQPASNSNDLAFFLQHIDDIPPDHTTPEFEKWVVTFPLPGLIRRSKMPMILWSSGRRTAL